MAVNMKSSRANLERLLSSKATISPVQLRETGCFGGLNQIYQACARGEIECIKIGRRFHIPTAPLRRRLGIESIAS